MFLVAGLGNPDKEYQGTRHNIGFMATDEIYRRFPFSEFKNKFQGLISEGSISNQKVLLVKPMTYMNSSGNCIGQIIRFYKIPPEKVIIIHDDMDLKVGLIKTKFGGGSGGHNGLKSIDSQIGNLYGRIRIGVGHPENKDEVINWVLSSFSTTDKKKIDAAIQLVSENIDSYIAKDWQAFASIIGEKLHGI